MLHAQGAAQNGQLSDADFDKFVTTQLGKASNYTASVTSAKSSVVNVTKAIKAKARRFRPHPHLVKLTTRWLPPATVSPAPAQL